MLGEVYSRLGDANWNYFLVSVMKFCTSAIYFLGEPNLTIELSLKGNLVLLSDLILFIYALGLIMLITIWFEAEVLPLDSSFSLH